MCGWELVRVKERDPCKETNAQYGDNPTYPCSLRSSCRHPREG